MDRDPTTTDVWLRTLLRVVGTTSLFALPFAVAPREWLAAIHQGLGMGTLPSLPVVGYLARSTSAFYALLGGLFWVVSFDLERHRQVIAYLGVTLTVFGAGLVVVDWAEGMPRFWTLWEGPFVVVFGVLLFTLNRGSGAGGP